MSLPPPVPSVETDDEARLASRKVLKDEDPSEYFWERQKSKLSGDVEKGDGESQHKVSHFLHKVGNKLKAPARAVHKIHHSADEDLSLSPHQMEEAVLRRSNSLSPEEIGFLQARRQRIAASQDLVRFLELPEGTVIDERDVPVIGLGGSGGGMRANLGFISTIMAFQELGLWSLVTYAAGVSGSCWSLASMYTLPLQPPLVSPLSAGPLLEHFRRICNIHPLSTKGVNKVAEAKGGIHSLLGPLVAKSKSGQQVCIIDLYSTLVSSFFWMIKGADGKDHIDPASMKWSSAFTNGKLAEGCEPFPILTAVRHERPWRDWKSKDNPFEDMDDHASEEHQARDAWWQWFELNPVEVGSEELEGWIPLWSFGRKFEQGRSVQSLPEHSLALLLGLSTAAPAAPLSSFLGTIWRCLPEGVVGKATRRGLKSFSRRMGDAAMDKLDNLNPCHASNESNPFFGAKKQPGRGNGFENSPRLHLVDSGMANNCPQHVFMHPARDVDVILLFDASSDVQRGAATERINEYGSTRGMNFTPRSELPPLTPLATETAPEDMRKRFEGRHAQIMDGKALHAREGKEGTILNDKHQPQAWRDTTLVYMPLLPNAANPTYDPSTAPFSSSYNLVWTGEQVDTIHKTATQNVYDGISTIRLAVREAYERRRATRLAGEEEVVERARRNIAATAVAVAEGSMKRVVVKSEERGEGEEDGTRRWMESA